jgi:hypothetical protein
MGPDQRAWALLLEKREKEKPWGYTECGGKNGEKRALCSIYAVGVLGCAYVCCIIVMWAVCDPVCVGVWCEVRPHCALSTLLSGGQESFTACLSGAQKPRESIRAAATNSCAHCCHNGQ